MDFTKFIHSKKYKDGKELYFDFDVSAYTAHHRCTFDYYKSLLYFLEKNPDKKIYVTQLQTDDFYEENNNIVINLDTYQKFCKSIGQNGENKAQAFLARNLRNFTEDEKRQILSDSSEDLIAERVSSFTKEQKNKFISNLESIEEIEFPKADLKNISSEDLLLAFSEFLKDPEKRMVLVENYPQVQIKILEDHLEFLSSNLNKEETFVHNWIDGKIDNNGNSLELTQEETTKLKKSRCLIFGLEYISHKREGSISSKRFDVLTRLADGKNDYVLIELKSPNSDVFKVVEKENQNDGKSTEYHLSNDTSRAIPQISDYRNLLENSTDSEWQKIGLPKGKVSKCLILIGTRKESDSVWESHFVNLKKNLSSSIEIMTYTDLIHKLETTIKNLRENL